MHIDLWHPTKNPDLDPREVGINSDFQVWWRGDCGHDFQQAVQRRAQSPFRSCQKCSHMGPTPRALLAQHPYADMWHPTKNDVDLASVGASTSRRFWWRGDCGHDFQQAAGTRTRSRLRTCPACSRGRR